jgi:cellulose biosynthesis protein BcsQ
MDTVKVLITNQKGGVGKSTISANLAAYLAIQESKKVSLIDFDKQSSASRWASKAPNIGIEIHHQMGKENWNELKEWVSLTHDGFPDFDGNNKEVLLINKKLC